MKGKAGSAPALVKMPAFVIDRREQLPYQLTPSVSGTLKSGDYSLVGMEEEVAIERKSKKDAYHSLFQERDRFERECERLSALPFAAVVIECSLPEFMQPPPLSQANPVAAACTVMSWMVRYRLPFVFAGDRRHAISTVATLLRFYWASRMAAGGGK